MSNPVLELSDQLKVAKADGQAIIDKAGAEKRSFTPEERTTLDNVSAKVKDLAADMERMLKFDSTGNGNTPATIGLTEPEARSFSVVKAIKAIAEGSWRGAEFEHEATEAAAKALGRGPKGLGFIMPDEVMHVRADTNPHISQIIKATATSGGDLVRTELLSASFIGLLRDKMIVKAAGARILSDLTGDVNIPKQVAGATAFWGGEDPTITASGQTFGLVSLTPHDLHAQTQISRRMLLQSSVDIENLVRDDIATVLALAVDLACLHGTGANSQPYGIASTTSVGSVTGGTNGALPTWANFISLESKVAVANAEMGALAYITNAAVRGYTKGAPKIGTAYPMYLWGEGAFPFNGYPVFITNQVSSTLTKGTATAIASAIFFGNWNDLLIGQWGTGLDVIVDPYTAPGAIRITSFIDVDVAVRHPESFAVMLDALVA
jgi:HK97 family phage major capsid protein